MMTILHEFFHNGLICLREVIFSKVCWFYPSYLFMVIEVENTRDNTCPIGQQPNSQVRCITVFSCANEITNDSNYFKLFLEFSLEALLGVSPF